MQWLLSISPLLSLVVNIIMNVLCIHFTNKISLSIFIGIASGFLAEITCLVSMLNNKVALSIDQVIISLISYFSLSFCYWVFLNLNITSLRVRLLRELLTGDNHTLNTEKLLKIYSSNELIDRRLQRLEKIGDIKKIENRWYLASKKLLLLTSFLENIRKLLSIDKK